MAAAALRYAARRLGGRTLQPPQRIYTTASENMTGSRAVRPTSSRGSRSSTSAGAATSSTQDACEQHSQEYAANLYLKEIQNKKEELFRMMANMDRVYPKYCTYAHIRLLTELSPHVEPKPDNPEWRLYRGAKKFNTFCVYGTLVYLVILVRLCL